MTTRVSMEEVFALRSRLREINDLNFADIIWTKDGVDQVFEADLIKDFSYVGLCNDNFITMGFYEGAQQPGY
jgi:hypothetical protein